MISSSMETSIPCDPEGTVVGSRFWKKKKKMMMIMMMMEKSKKEEEDCKTHELLHVDDFKD